MERPYKTVVSIVIPSYNSAATIRACLDSILTQDFSGEVEVIVVDSSIDNTPFIIRDQYPAVICHHLDKKTDPGTARNMGVAQSQGQVILFIDSDCVARPGWIRCLISCHEATDDGVIGGSVENANPHSAVSLASYMVEFSDFLPTMKKGFLPHLPTCNISYKRRLFEKFGGFDSRYYPQEDYYFHWRLRKGGERIHFVPAAQVAHHHRTTWRSYFAHQKQIGRITALVLKVTDLPGSGFVGRPLLAAAVIPLLPFIKFTRTMVRCLTYMPGPMVRRPWSAIVLFVGLLIWGVGFAEGTYKRDR